MLLNSLPKLPLFSLPSQYFSSAIGQAHRIAPFYSSTCQGGTAIATDLPCVKSWHIIFHFQELLEIVKHLYCSYSFILLCICIFLSAQQADTAVFKSPSWMSTIKTVPIPTPNYCRQEDATINYQSEHSQFLAPQK